MTKWLSLADVDRLLDTLDRTNRDSADWRAPFEELNRNFKRARDVRLHGLNIIWLGALLFFAAKLYSVQWEFDALFRNGEFLLVIIALNLFPLLVTALFPVLRREERVVALLRHFEADAPDGEQGARERVPPHVALALETLEKATSPIGLRAAFEIVEDWRFASAVRWTWNGIYIAIFWFLAFVVAMFGDNLGMPDFLRGAAFMFVGMVAWLTLKRLTYRGSIVRRVEEALGRWRHLVPAMGKASQ